MLSFRLLAHLFGLVILCWSTIHYMMGHLDLSPLFGPGGVKSIAALLADYPQRDWGTWVMNLCMDFAEDEEGAARLAIWLGYVATVLGISLCGFRLNAWAGARVSALITLCFFHWNTVLVGPDGIATVSHAGDGITWISTGVGGGAFHFAVSGLPQAAKIKITTPARLKRHRSPARHEAKWTGKVEGIIVGAFIAGTFYLKQNWMPSANNHIAGGQAASLSWDTMQLGWTQLQKVFDEEDVIVQLCGFGIAGAVLPGRNWFSRMGLSLLCAVVLCITASTLGMKIRPRYFVAAELPIIILLASALTQYRWLRPVGQVASLALLECSGSTTSPIIRRGHMMTRLSGK